MKYCKKCRNEILDEEKFCSVCGYKQKKSAHEKQKDVGKFICATAYIGTMFWLPLIIQPSDNYTRTCANQGLWILILSYAGCTGFSILKAANIFCSKMVPLTGWFGFLLSTIGGGLYTIAFTALLAFMAFLAINCIMGIHSVYNDCPLHILPFFGKYKIIRDRSLRKYY